MKNLLFNCAAILGVSLVMWFSSCNGTYEQPKFSEETSLWFQFHENGVLLDTIFDEVTAVGSDRTIFHCPFGYNMPLPLNESEVTYRFRTGNETEIVVIDYNWETSFDGESYLWELKDYYVRSTTFETTNVFTTTPVITYGNESDECNSHAGTVYIHF
jgi:hypothetical protein